jgi:hypothetical protein
MYCREQYLARGADAVAKPLWSAVARPPLSNTVLTARNDRARLAAPVGTPRGPLTTQAVIDALGATVPLSVSRREDIARIRAAAQGRFVPV